MIRPARADEAAWVAETVDAAFGIYVPRIGRKPAPMDADHAASIDAGEVHVFERDGERLGLIVQRAESDHLFIDIVAVLPAAQHGGVGKALLDFAEAEAKRLGLPALRLYTHAKMTENRRFYPKRGFRETGAKQEDGFDRVTFEKRLG